MRKTKPAAKSVPVPISPGTSVDVDVRKIQNGYIVRQSMSTPRGYKSTETYHPTKPTVGINVNKSEK